MGGGKGMKRWYRNPKISAYGLDESLLSRWLQALLRACFIALVARPSDSLPYQPLLQPLRRQRGRGRDRSADGKRPSTGSGGRSIGGTGATPVGTAASEDSTQQPGNADTDDDTQRPVGGC